jgi:hypothetical protein
MRSSSPIAAIAMAIAFGAYRRSALPSARCMQSVRVRSAAAAAALRASVTPTSGEKTSSRSLAISSQMESGRPLWPLQAIVRFLNECVLPGGSRISQPFRLYTRKERTRKTARISQALCASAQSPARAGQRMMIGIAEVDSIAVSA